MSTRNGGTPCRVTSRSQPGAIEHYNAIIEATDGVDYVTQDMVIGILRDEEGHRRLFEGYLREYEADPGR